MEEMFCEYSGLPSISWYASLEPIDTDRVIEMAWEDRTPFEAIEAQFGLKEGQVVEIMRQNLKSSSFKRWRAHVRGRKTKHLLLRDRSVNRFKCTRQRPTSNNRISKRK